MKERDMFNVLVADDEENFREIFKDLLRSERLNVLSAGEGGEVIRKLLDFDVHLLLLDKNFPSEQNGIETLQKVKEMRPDLDVIMLTAYPDAESNLEFMRMGAHSYLHKAQDVRLISETVKHLIESIRLKQENRRLLNELQEKNKWLEEMKSTFKRWNTLLIKKISNLREDIDAPAKKGVTKNAPKNTELLILSFIHELNNRFQVAQGIFSCIDSEVENEEEAPLRHLKNLFDELSGVTTNFCDLAFGKAEDTEFDLGLVISNAVGTARYFCLNSPISLRKEIDPDLPQIFGQPRLLLDAIMNLTKNAVEALQKMPEDYDSKIILKAFKKGDKVIIEVLDSGPQLPPEIVESLFKPFFTTKPEGNGIGLAWVKQAVKAHHGNLSFGRTDDGFNCFRIKIPIMYTEIL